MNEVDIALAVVGGLVLVVGLFSQLARRWSVSEPLVGLVVGVGIGPVGLGLLHPDVWADRADIMEQVGRVTLAVGLMGVALRLPKADPFRRWRSLAALLGVLMPAMWLVSGLLVYLLLGLPFWVAMLIGAVLTPTDPVVATSLVTGKVAEEHLPARIRHTISEESGFNDGLAYPFLMLPIFMLTRPPGDALSHWVTRTLLWEIGGAIIFGVILGYAAGWLLEWAEANAWVERTSFLAYTIALTLVALGGGALLGVESLLAVFLAGIAFDMAVSADERQEEERVQESVYHFLIFPIFVLLGALLPWAAWGELGWRGVALVVAVLLLRRLPTMLALRPLLGRVASVPDALYMGWFGPIGVAALYFSSLAERQAGVEEAWIIGSLVVCGSLLAHGLTSSPLTFLFGRRVGREKA